MCKTLKFGHILCFGWYYWPENIPRIERISFAASSSYPLFSFWMSEWDDGPIYDRTVQHKEITRFDIFFFLKKNIQPGLT